ncbi:MAG: hypothetical protein V1926_04495 [Candidatus Peregrinibacteria bacterium]
MPMPPIRAIVSRFSFDFSHAALQKAVDALPFEFVCHIAQGGTPVLLKGIPAEHQDWFDSSEVRGCLYRGTDFAALRPLDEKLIESLAECQIGFMETVRRLEWKKEIPYGTRKIWYLRHLQFWNDYLERHRINLFLSAWIPHEIPEVILYYLCAYKKIPILYFHMSTERDMQFAEHAIREPAPRLRARFAALLEEYKGVSDPEGIPLRPPVLERFRALTDPRGEQPALEQVKHPTYWSDVRALLTENFLRFLRAGLGILTPRGLARAFGAWQRARHIRRRRTYYDAHAVSPDFSKRFVYFPLHMQPEASTCPMAGAFVDQILIAQLLQATLPDDVLIYVKEHPKESSWVMRSTDYYRDFLALPKVRLIARHADTFRLREHCCAVATGTGSAGFEALFRGKPAFLFGHRFHQYAHGVFSIHTTEDLRRAVHAVFQSGAKPNLADARLYLKAMDESCIHGTLSPWNRVVSRVSDSENIRANSEAIIAEINDLLPLIAGVH